MAASGDDVVANFIGVGHGMYGGGSRWTGECRVGVAGRKDMGGDVTDGTGAQPLGCAGGLDICNSENANKNNGVLFVNAMYSHTCTRIYFFQI